MEDYNKKIDIGKDGEVFLVSRLTVKKTIRGYGYSVFDKLKKVYLYNSYDREKALIAKDMLEKNPESELPSTEGEIPPPKLIIFEEKHCDLIYDVSTEEKLFEASLKVVNRRVEEGFWYDEPNNPGKFELTISEINELPDGSIKSYAIEMMGFHKKRVDIYNDSLEYLSIIREIIEKQDGKMAYLFLEDRKQNEYEDFKILEPGNY